MRDMLFLSKDSLMDLSLNDERGVKIGALVPLEERHLSEQFVIDKITEWRNANMHCFLSEFLATPDRTRTWIKDVVLKSDRQMLWLLYDVNDKLVGHLGFKDLSADHVMMDNGIRAERDGHPKLFVIAGQALIQWLLANTLVNEVRTIVLADNVPAIMANRQMGFSHSKRYPLVSEGSSTEEKRLVVGLDGPESPIGRYCLHMWLTRNPTKLM